MIQEKKIEMSGWDIYFILLGISFIFGKWGAFVTLIVLAILYVWVKKSEGGEKMRAKLQSRNSKRDSKKGPNPVIRYKKLHKEKLAKAEK